MANWLEITSTFINYQTLQRVSDLSNAQQQVANQMLAVELRKQKDNALLSQLVDIVVKVRQFVQDRQFLDALLSSCVGVIAFKQLYPRIVDADMKLKASDIQAKLLETIRSTVSDISIKQNLQLSLSQYFSSINASLEHTLTQMQQSHHEPVWLDPRALDHNHEEYSIDVGEECTPLRNLYQPSTNTVIFSRGNLYKVIALNTAGTWGFYLINDLGKNHFVHFGENGAASLFIFFDPPLPSLDCEFTGWELCEKSFSDAFLLENLKSLHSKMLSIHQQAYDQAKISKDQLANSFLAYKQLRQSIIKKSLISLDQSFLEQRTITKKQNLKAFLYVIGSCAGLALLALLLALLIRDC